MITVTKVEKSPRGDSISFTIEFRDVMGRLQMQIRRCRIKGGFLYGPSRRLRDGTFIPQVEFHRGQLKASILDAVEAAGLKRDFPRVKFPEAPPLHAAANLARRAGSAAT
jgi:hypothetical protein